MIEIIPDKKYKNMWRLKWPHGTISVRDPNYDLGDGVIGFYGFYNKTRALELARLCNERTRFEGYLKVGEVWEFPEMGRLHVSQSGREIA